MKTYPIQQQIHCRSNHRYRLHFPSQQEPAVRLPFHEFSTDDLITTEVLADWLGLKADTLVKARSTGFGDYPPYEKFGRSVRYRIGDVRAWLQARKRDHGGYLE